MEQGFVGHNTLVITRKTRNSVIGNLIIRCLYYACLCVYVCVCFARALIRVCLVHQFVIALLQGLE